MHINYGRGETREFVYRCKDGSHWYRDEWFVQRANERREIRQAKTVESFYEDTPYKKKRGQKKGFFLGYKLWKWDNKQGYATEKARQDALYRHERKKKGEVFYVRGERKTRGIQNLYVI
jgi:hypothetical protein